MATSIDPETIATSLPNTIDLISSALGGRILSFSDEFFAEASNLLTPTPPIRRAGHYVATGAWYDGWETRRHNQAPSDWVIVALGVSSGHVAGIEVDTAYFNGNHAPSISVEGLFQTPDVPTPQFDDARWESVLSERECGPSARHVWKLDSESRQISHLRLQMYPDGGIARFRVFGRVVPVWPEDKESIIDLAAAGNGGVAVKCSDQHFGGKDYLLLPGRGKDMGDGWETKRSREKGHVDWVIVKLGAPGTLEEIVVDTLHFRGNFPQAVEVYATNATDADPAHDDAGWQLVVAKSPCQKDTEHAFTTTKGLSIDEDTVVTHVKMVIIPDGGVKRLRVFGKRRVMAEVKA